MAALKQLTSDQFDIQVSTTSSIVVVPKWDCYVEMQFQFNGWGYAGKKWAIQIKPPQGITTILNGTGVLEGGDIITKNICFSSIFSNLKKGVSYTFARESIEGSPGGGSGTTMIAKLYRTI